MPQRRWLLLSLSLVGALALAALFFWAILPGHPSVPITAGAALALLALTLLGARPPRGPGDSGGTGGGLKLWVA